MQKENTERVRGDDYETIVFKILLHQYGLLKRKIVYEPISLVRCLCEEGKITEGYISDVLRMMQESGYIEGVAFVNAWGTDTLLASDLSNARITHAGICYLTNDETMKRLHQHFCVTPGLTSTLVKLVIPE